jgi:hypothetical protein
MQVSVEGGECLGGFDCRRLRNAEAGVDDSVRFGSGMSGI